MARICRPVIGVESATGQVKQWQSAYACARELGVVIPAIAQAQSRCGECNGWKMYDAPEYYEKRIAELEVAAKEVKKLLAR